MNFFSFIFMFVTTIHIMSSCPFQAYNLSRDHKPDLEVERDRILKAGGFIHAGRVNGSLNLARAIGDIQCSSCTFLIPAIMN